MNVGTILMVSIGLAMDAFAVSITSGVVLKKKFNIKTLLKIGLFFTFFQALMPLIGWGLGSRFSIYIKNFDHWVAFVLLLLIGIKMVYDSIAEEDEKTLNPADNRVLLFLSLATSIDALAVGVSFAFLDISILFAVFSIGVVTFVLTIVGILLGKISGDRLKKKAELFGGIVLALIGTKILLEHLHIF
ncbi:manganese efflux pump MntP family protein [Bacillus carboniphilus]|uniref:Putative manganese efflux pump MntP n=1 Tax=Bacillus carboniphilus TaxID=86663 RepID=A0ABN0WPD6_9BACI